MPPAGWTQPRSCRASATRATRSPSIARLERRRCRRPPLASRTPTPRCCSPTSTPSDEDEGRVLVPVRPSVWREGRDKPGVGPVAAAAGGSGDGGRSAGDRRRPALRSARRGASCAARKRAAVSTTSRTCCCWSRGAARAARRRSCRDAARALPPGHHRRVPGHRSGAVGDLPQRSSSRAATPRPLYVVGDPKQAIYGFRGADVNTYDGTRAAPSAPGGTHRLERNFRSTPAVIDALQRASSTRARRSPSSRPGAIGYAHPVTYGRRGERAGRPACAPLIAADACKAGRRGASCRCASCGRAGDARSPTRSRRCCARPTAPDCARDLRAHPHPQGVAERWPTRWRRAACPPCLPPGGPLRDRRGAPGPRPAARDRRPARSRQAPARVADAVLRAAASGSAGGRARGADHRCSIGCSAGTPPPRAAIWPTCSAASSTTAASSGASCSPATPAPADQLPAAVRDAGRRGRPGQRRPRRRLARRLPALVAQLIVPAPEEGNTLRVEGDRDAVQIMTMHRAKGLEADVVFVYGGFGPAPNDTVRSYVDRRPPAAPGGAAAPATAITRLVKRERDGEDQRLYYVALTRARKRLYLPYSGKVPEGTRRRSSPPPRRILAAGGRLPARQPAAARADERAGPRRLLEPHEIRDRRARRRSRRRRARRRRSPPGAPPRRESRPIDADPTLAALRRARAGAVTTSYSRIKQAHGGYRPPTEMLDEVAAPRRCPARGDATASCRGGAATGIFLHALLEELPLADAARDAGARTPGARATTCAPSSSRCCAGTGAIRATSRRGPAPGARGADGAAAGRRAARSPGCARGAHRARDGVPVPVSGRGRRRRRAASSKDSSTSSSSTKGASVLRRLEDRPAPGLGRRRRSPRTSAPTTRCRSGSTRWRWCGCSASRRGDVRGPLRRHALRLRARARPLGRTRSAAGARASTRSSRWQHELARTLAGEAAAPG